MKKILYALTCTIIITVACGTSSTPISPAFDPNIMQTVIAGTALAAQNQTQIVGVSTETPMPMNSPLPTSSPIPTNPPIPTVPPNQNLIKPGTYLVGTDIQVGIYKGRVGAGIFDTCYWQRLKDLSGQLEGILANDNGIGQYYVEIRQGDYAFMTACEIERLDSLPEPIAEFPVKILPGTYLVGREIKAGTYKGQQVGNDIMSSCYWARLSNVAGEFDAIIANENAVGQFYLQVAASDFALTTACELERVGD